LAFQRPKKISTPILNAIIRPNSAILLSTIKNRQSKIVNQKFKIKNPLSKLLSGFSICWSWLLFLNHHFTCYTFVSSFYCIKV
jgi:hypothetical protein